MARKITDSDAYWKIHEPNFTCGHNVFSLAHWIFTQNGRFKHEIQWTSTTLERSYFWLLNIENTTYEKFSIAVAFLYIPKISMFPKLIYITLSNKGRLVWKCNLSLHILNLKTSYDSEVLVIRWITTATYTC